ncbi:hypothetical protein [Kitasatospora sp. McL0602]|uniref:hypothetical protein n=1 Tax=Kitasatospora sp. McL0602 TaxID=3439530 RepID=UPI003F8B76EE
MRIARNAAKIGAAFTIALSAATLTSAPAHADSWQCRAPVYNVGPLNLTIKPCIAIHNSYILGKTDLYYSNGAEATGVTTMVGLNHISGFYRVSTSSAREDWPVNFSSDIYHGSSYNVSGGYYYNGVQYGDVQSPVAAY